MQLYGYKFKSHVKFFSFIMGFFNEFCADLYPYSSWFQAVVNWADVSNSSKTFFISSRNLASLFIWSDYVMSKRETEFPVTEFPVSKTQVNCTLVSKTEVKLTSVVWSDDIENWSQFTSPKVIFHVNAA